MNQTSESFSIIVRDGLKLYGMEWLLDDPKAAIILIHGLGEHIGRYEHVAKHFNEIGLSVFSYDLRGHGMSEGKRGHTPSYDRMLEDIEEVMMYARAEYNELPLFLFGHSMGGNLVTNYVLRKNVNELSGTIISSPWLRTVNEIPESKINQARFVNKIFPSLTKPNGLDTSLLTYDSNVNKAYVEDPLVHDRISVRTFLEFYDAGFWALDHPDLIKIKTLVYHGADDMITSPKASSDFAKASNGKAEFKLYPETKHEPHNDLKKEEVLSDVSSWIKKLL